MAPKSDHYQTLGVERDATQEGIRKAFRRRAKECHPDCAESLGDEQFRELNKAHEVLSDPASRRSYDRELRSEDRRERPPRASEPSWREWRVPRDVGAPRPWSPGELVRDVGGPSGAGWPLPAEEALHLELVLSRGEQLFGARVPLVLQLARACPSCQSAGVAARLGCITCGGLGEVIERASFEVLVPAGLRPGRVVSVRLTPPLVDAPVQLDMTVRIDPFF